MKWYAALPLAALAALPAGSASAQANRHYRQSVWVGPRSARHAYVANTAIRRVFVGHIANVADRTPSLWGMSGMSIFRISQTVGGMTPIMRTETMDARTVEILSRTQAPPLRPTDIRAVNREGRHFITVRNYLLFEVTPQDAQAEGTTQAQLASRWAARVRHVLPQVAPAGNPYGV